MKGQSHFETQNFWKNLDWSLHDKVLAEKYGYTASRVAQARHLFGSKFVGPSLISTQLLRTRSQRIKAVRGLIDGGLSQEEVGIQLGLTRQAVNQILNPEKTRARAWVARALQLGMAKPSHCENCGSAEDLEAHHQDYSKPLAIRWVCHPCHMRQHVESSKAA